MTSRRTTGMTVIALLNILFGGLGLLLSALGVGEALMRSRQAILIQGSMGLAAPANSEAQQSLFATLLAMSLLGLVIGLLACIAGLSLFFMWRKARMLNLSYASISILRSFLLLFVPAVTSPSNISPSGFEQKLVGLSLALIYPTIVILLFARADWKAAFANENAHLTQETISWR